MSKKDLSERDICTQFITPAVKQAGWDIHAQIREEVSFTKGRIIVRGKLVTRGKPKRADYILYYKPNISIAIIEAKDNNHAIGDGMQQALEYAATLDIPFVFSSNGDAFLFHDRTGRGSQIESELPIESFPTPTQLWSRYCGWKGLAPAEEAIVLQDYYEDAGGKEPRYYQSIAINRAIEAIAKGQNRILLVMATGTGKTYTAFQIIWYALTIDGKDLHLAVRFLLDALEQPTLIRQYTSVTQDISFLRERGEASWIEPYVHRTRDRRIDTLLSERRPVVNSWTGGNSTLYFYTPERPVPQTAGTRYRGKDN